MGRGGEVGQEAEPEAQTLGKGGFRLIVWWGGDGVEERVKNIENRHRIGTE